MIGTTLSVVNAGLALLIAVIVAVVGLYQVRRITHERLNETIDEYAKIATAKDERIEELTKQATRQSETAMNLTHRLGVVEGHNRWLLQQSMLAEQYIQLLAALCRRQGTPLPPRPTLEDA